MASKKPQFIIAIDYDSNTISVGTDDIGIRQIPIDSETDVEWAESLRDYLRENGFSVDYDDGE